MSGSVCDKLLLQIDHDGNPALTYSGLYATLHD
jgi:hypothetical protein